VLLGKVARGRSDDRSFADYNFAVLLESLPDVVFAYKVGGFGDTLGSLRCCSRC